MSLEGGRGERGRERGGSVHLIHRIEMNNIQVELIRFRKQIATLLTLETLKWEYTFTTDVFTRLGSLLSLTSRH